MDVEKHKSNLDNKKNKYMKKFLIKILCLSLTSFTF